MDLKIPAGASPGREFQEVALLVCDGAAVSGCSGQPSPMGQEGTVTRVLVGLGGVVGSMGAGPVGSSCRGSRWGEAVEAVGTLHGHVCLLWDECAPGT